MKKKIGALCDTYFNPRPHMLFPHHRTHMGGGGCNPHVISPLNEIELWNKDQTNPWDLLSAIVPELTSLGHILTPPPRSGQRKEDSDFKIYSFSQITLELRKIENNSSTIVFLSSRRIETFTF